MRDRHIQSIRFVGSVALGIGAILICLTLLIALVTLFSARSTDPGSFVRGLIHFGTALVMSSALMGLGAQLQSARYLTSGEVENIRLVWTSLVLVMTLSVLVSLWLGSPLVFLGGLMLVLLLLIRGAIVRLSR